MAALRFWLILGEIPALEYNQFKWKIEGPLTLRALKKYFSEIFFSKIFFKSGLFIASISATLDPQRTSLRKTTTLYFRRPPSHNESAQFRPFFIVTFFDESSLFGFEKIIKKMMNRQKK